MNYSPTKIGFVPLQLDGPSQVQLERALLDGFRSMHDLRTLVGELDKPLAAFERNGSPKETIAAIVGDARAQGWDGNLVLTAGLLNPGNVEVQKFALRFYSPNVKMFRAADPAEKLDFRQPAAFRNLERVVTQRLGFLRVETFLESYTKMSRQICKVEVAVGNTLESGTGFLVGPEVVLTNYHVVEDLIAAKGGASSVNCRFDYLGSSRGLDGTTRSLSRTAAFPIAWAKPSVVDTLADDGSQLPGSDELDYALLRLDTAVGDEVLRNDGTTRDFVKITGAHDPATKPDAFAPGAALVIMQHPNGQPLSLAIDTEGVLGVNGNGTRLRYRTNTDEGSSGSPCCTMDLAPIALHHAGDPKYAFRYKPKFNQGIPLHLIVEHIRAHFASAADLLG